MLASPESASKYGCFDNCQNAGFLILTTWKSAHFGILGLRARQRGKRKGPKIGFANLSEIEKKQQKISRCLGGGKFSASLPLFWGVAVPIFRLFFLYLPSAPTWALCQGAVITIQENGLAKRLLYFPELSAPETVLKSACFLSSSSYLFGPMVLPLAGSSCMHWRVKWHVSF